MLGQHWPGTLTMMQYYSHNCRYSFRLSEGRERCSVAVSCILLGDLRGVVNSLDFCPASLKSLGCFCFRVPGDYINNCRCGRNAL